MFINKELSSDIKKQKTDLNFIFFDLQFAEISSDPFRCLLFLNSLFARLCLSLPIFDAQLCSRFLTLGWCWIRENRSSKGAVLEIISFISPVLSVNLLYQTIESCQPSFVLESIRFVQSRLQFACLISSAYFFVSKLGNIPEHELELLGEERQPIQLPSPVLSVEIL